MTKLSNLFIFFFLCISVVGRFFLLSASTSLSGNIGGMTLDKTSSPYIITKDIVIPAGEKTVIKEGVALLFASFTGMMVSGGLYVEGSSEQPVSFSSVQDANHNDSAATLPTAFDWNGIIIERDAGEVKMRNFEVKYSVYGIKSKKRDIVLVNAVFRENGQYNFTINDELMMVEEKLSYSYNADKVKAADSTGLKVSEKEKRLATLSPKQLKLRRAGIVSLISGGVGCVGAVLLFGLTGKYSNLYRTEKTDFVKIQNYKDRYYSFKNAGIITAVGSGAVLVTSLILYLAHKKIQTDQPKMQIKVSLGCGAYPLASDIHGNKQSFDIMVIGNF